MLQKVQEIPELGCTGQYPNTQELEFYNQPITLVYTVDDNKAVTVVAVFYSEQGLNQPVTPQKSPYASLPFVSAGWYTKIRLPASAAISVGFSRHAVLTIKAEPVSSYRCVAKWA